MKGELEVAMGCRQVSNNHETFLFVVPAYNLTRPPRLVLRGRSGVAIGYGYAKGISLEPTFRVPVAYGHA